MGNAARRRRDQGHDGIMVHHDIVFSYAQLEIENVEELALNPANVALAKYSCAHSPVYVLKRRVIQIL